MPKNLLNEAKKLLPKTNYIGFSITQGNEYRKKSWSIYKFISLANKSLIKNKIPVFFIEKKRKKLELSKKIFLKLQKNNHNYNSDLTHISMKHSPKNLIVNTPDFVLKHPNMTVLPKEVIQSNNQIYKNKNYNENNEEENKKVYIPIEDCNKRWDYKVHGDDWQCLVIYFK